MNLTGKSIAVLGAGESGAAAARLAKARGGEVTVLDSGDASKLGGRSAELEESGISTVFGDAALATPGRFDLVVSSPGIDPAWPIARQFFERGDHVIGEFEFGYSAVGCPVVAITGTNGKTTTTGLAADVLESGGQHALPCANFGEPLSSVALRGERYDVLVAEASSFQLELIESFHPGVAVWMNFAPDHLDRHPTLASYREAKLRIFENQEASDWAIVRQGEESVDLKALAAKTLTFSAYDGGADFVLVGEEIRFRGEAVADLSATQLRGRHNAENAMAAMAVGHARGIEFSAMQASLQNYHPSAHRCEPVGVVDGIEFINDSKSTNLHAMESALRALDTGVVLIAGGKDKGLDYTPLAKLVGERARGVVAIGEISQVLADAWGKAVPTVVAGTVADAVGAAREMARAGDAVLFSPGSSSFDMFRSYAQRGDAFREAVAGLGETNNLKPTSP